MIPILKSTTTLTVTAMALLFSSGQARAPEWKKIPDLCRQLRAEGFKPAPDGIGDAATGEMVVQRIFLCHLRQDLPARTGGKPAHVEVFMQHRGGESLSVTTAFWAEADRAAALDAAGRTVTRVARELGITLPPGLIEGVKKGDDPEERVNSLRFRTVTETRESELRLQPDLKASDVPLVKIKISIAPDDDEDGAQP